MAKFFFLLLLTTRLIWDVIGVTAEAETETTSDGLLGAAGSVGDVMSGDQRFVREPLDQITTIGEHVTLPCRVSNKLGTLQWTRDDFGLGTDRNLTGYKRYKMTGSDDEGKTQYYISFC